MENETNEGVEYVEVDEIEGEDELDPSEKAIEAFFEDISPGMTVMIRRLEPTEYQGILETKTVSDADNPIDMNYLINRWGGHKLRLKFRRPNGRWAKHIDIDLYSYEPLVLGQPLKRDIVSPHLNPGETQIQVSPPPPPAPPPDPLAGLTPLLAVLQGMRQGEMELITKILPQSQPPPQAPMVSQLGEIMGLVTQMLSFAQQNAPQPQALNGNDGDEAQLMGLVGKAIDAFGATQGKEKVTKLTASNQRPGTPAIQNIRPIKTLDQQLSELPPDEILTTFQTVLSKLPADKQNIAMEQLLDALEKLGMIEGDDPDPEEVEDVEDNQEENTGGTT